MVTYYNIDVCTCEHVHVLYGWMYLYVCMHVYVVMVTMLPCCDNIKSIGNSIM